MKKTINLNLTLEELQVLDEALMNSASEATNEAEQILLYAIAEKTGELLAAGDAPFPGEQVH